MKWLKLTAYAIGFLVAAFIFQLIREKFSAENLNRKRPNPLYGRANNTEPVDGWFKDLIDSAKCSLNTTDIKKAAGIKMKVYYPCHWKYYPPEAGTIILAYYSNSLKGESNASMAVSVEDMGEHLSDAYIKKVSAISFLKQSVEGEGGYFISAKNIKVDGVRGNEVILRKTLDKKDATGFYMYHYFYYKNTLINVALFTAANTAKEASALFEKYKPLFRKWINKTEFLR